MTERTLWIDPRFRAAPPRPWRKIHLDFHNSEYIPQIGTSFDPDEFGDRLLAGHVDSIVVFAKDMHGYFYYPTRYEPRHPGLDFDLLGAQVAACRARNIKVYAYYCTTWDNYLAERHPEWLVFRRDRSTFLPKFDEPPAWTALCLTNEDFVQLVLDHTRETLETYELDGIWYDMPLPRDGECYCRNCLATLRAAGKDPFDRTVQREHKQALLTDFMRRAHEQAHSIRPGCQVDQNNQTRLGLGERAPFMDNIDIEALPTAFWGYWYFPVNVRYARTFGTSVCGMSGRFHRSWADFGGLKHPNQLRIELAGIIAQGAQCDLGDQLPPSGRLDPAVYATIGECYAEIEQIEPWLKQAVPATEAAILVNGRPLDDVGHPEDQTVPGESLGASVVGLTRLLTECRVQFDIVEADTPWDERYRLVLLPDNLSVTPELAQRLNAYLAGGGAVLAGPEAMFVQGSVASWATDLKLSYKGRSAFTPAYLKLHGNTDLWAGLPEYEYALYDGASQLLAHDPATVLAWIGEPLFQRSAAHYTSHAQTPFHHVSDYAAVLLQGRLGAFGFPIGGSYYHHGYWIYRELFQRLLNAVLPTRVITSNAPLSAELALTNQAATAEHPERWMLHVVNYSANRRSPAHCEYHEDPIPLRDVDVTLTLPGGITGAYDVRTGDNLPITSNGASHTLTIPHVHFGAIIALDAAQG